MLFAKCAPLIAATMVSCLPALAQAAGPFMDGNELQDACKRADGELYCLGFTTGVYDALGMTVCPPPGVTMIQVRDIIVKYVADHPEQRHLPAYHLAHNSLEQAFPC